MKLNSITEIKERFGKRTAGSLSGDEHDELLFALQSIKEIHSAEDAQIFLELLALLRSVEVRHIEGFGKNAKDTITGAFAGGDEGVYAADSGLMNARFIFELVQNVDDCRYIDESKCKLRIEFDVQRDIIRLQYNEIGFLPENVMAITGLGNSTKNHNKANAKNFEKEIFQKDLQEIGEKGIGFKSIFGLAKEVKISSNYFCFNIKRDNFFVPVVGDYDEFRYSDATIMELLLDDGMADELFIFLKEKYDNVEAIINENPILFLNKLTEIEYYKNDKEFFGFKVSRTPDNKEYTIEDTKIEYYSSKERNKVIDAYRFSHVVNYSVEECQSRYGDSEDSGRTHKIIVIAPKDASLIEKGCIYSFFATEEKINAPFIIHAPFKLNSGRTKIDSQSQSAISDNKWFIKTRQETVRMVKYAYENLARFVGNNICHYIPLNTLTDQNCPLTCDELSRETILTWNIFKTVEDSFLPAKDVCMIDYLADKTVICDIHNILQVEKPLIYVSQKYLKHFDGYGIEKIKNVNNELLKRALIEENVVERCLEYTHDFIPDFTVGDIFEDGILLSYKQLQCFAKYEKIIEWINNHTIEDKLYDLDEPTIRTVYNCDSDSIETIIEFCEEYSNEINKEFIEYCNNVVFFEVDFERTVITDNAVFGNEALSCFAEIYKKFEPKDKFFYPFLLNESVSEEINRLCSENSGLSDYEYIKQLCIYRKNQKNNLKKQYSNILQLIENAGTKVERFFPEILQNIDDCQYNDSPNVVIRMEETKDGNKLHFEYNEVGFTREQIRAITAIGDSTKKKLFSSLATGEKGIGFKSVFSICNSVSITSGNYKFILKAETPTIPEDIKEIPYFKGTSMVFAVKKGYEKTINQMLSDKHEMVRNCLCLNQVRSLFINQKQLSVNDTENKRIVKFGNDTFSFYKYSYRFKIQNHAALHQRKKNKTVSEVQHIDYIVPMNDGIWNYCVYSTFPTEEKVLLPILINMQLDLDTARERILEGEWNKEIIHTMMEGLIDLYELLKDEYKERLPLLFPQNGGVLEHKYGHSTSLMNEIASAKLFKLKYKDDFVSLEDGMFSNEFEYLLFDKYYGDENSKIKSELLAKDNECFGMLQSAFNDRVQEREFGEICDTINEILNWAQNNNKSLLSEKEFREALYLFLMDSSSILSGYAETIKKWEIVPIKNRDKTIFESYSEMTFAPGKGDINSEKYKILDTNILSIREYNGIFEYITGKYKPIEKFSKDVIITDFLNEVLFILNMPRATENDRKKIAENILRKYESEKDLFEEMIRTRKDFPNDLLLFITRTGVPIERNICYFCDEAKSYGCLDKIIVSNEFSKLAQVIGLSNVKAIRSYKDIHFEIGLSELLDLKEIKLQHHKELFNSLYLHGERAMSLNDGEGFFELYKLTSKEIRCGGNQAKLKITLDDELLQNYANEINEISIGDTPVSFIMETELIEFEKSEILAEIEAELQIREKTKKTDNVLQLVQNCFYANLYRKEPCCIRTSGKKLLLIDSKLSSDYEIIDALKGFFLDYYHTEISINRTIRLYNRKGFENISTINASEDVVEQAKRFFINVNLSNIEEIKDILCKPLTVNGITYGGYAKTCPICGTRVDTELTGFRMYKTKCNNVIVPLFSCCNCYENFRYSSDIDIDIKKLNQGILCFQCDINGTKWSKDNIVLRLGHRAFINKINSK